MTRQMTTLASEQGQQSVAQQEAQIDAENARLQAQITSTDGSDDGKGEGLSGAMATEVKQLLASWNPDYAAIYRSCSSNKANATSSNNSQASGGAQGLSLSGKWQC